MRYFCQILFLFIFSISCYCAIIYEPFFTGMPSEIAMQQNTNYRYYTSKKSNQQHAYKLNTSYFSKKRTGYSSEYNPRPFNYQSVNRSEQTNYQYYTNTYQFSNKRVRKSKTVFIEEVEERPDIGIRMKDVSQGGLLDWIVYAFGGDPANGGYVVNDDGELIKITNEDWEAYNNDPTYRELIDSGEVIKYDDAQERYPELFAPIGDEFLLLVFIILYVFIKFKHRGTLEAHHDHQI